MHEFSGRRRVHKRPDQKPHWSGQACPCGEAQGNAQQALAPEGKLPSARAGPSQRRVIVQKRPDKQPRADSQFACKSPNRASRSTIPLGFSHRFFLHALIPTFWRLAIIAYRQSDPVAARNFGQIFFVPQSPAAGIRPGGAVEIRPGQEGTHTCTSPTPTTTTRRKRPLPCTTGKRSKSSSSPSLWKATNPKFSRTTGNRP